MNDDLKQRLSDLAYGTGSRSPQDAIDRIEELERDNYRWKMECEEFWRSREAKAVKALRKIADFSQGDVVKYIQGVDAIALDALAELEAQDD